MEKNSRKKQPIGPPPPKIVITSLPFIAGMPELMNKKTTYNDRNTDRKMASEKAKIEL